MKTTMGMGRTDRIDDLFRPMLDHLLTELGLVDVYSDPLAHQGSRPFAEQVAQRMGVSPTDDRAVRQVFESRCMAYLDRNAIELTQEQRSQIFERLRSEMFGFGPLDALLNDAEVTEIMINAPRQIFVVCKGRLVKSEVVFDDIDHLMRVIQRILLPLGRRVDRRSPAADARLPDGSLVTVVVPPLAINGPTITIRKFHRMGLTMEDMIRFGTLTREMAEFLSACVRGRFNILVAGGINSGKTTLQNTLTRFIPDGERIITVEEVAQLQVHKEHLISLESQPPNSEGTGATTMRDLLHTAVRMQPDRLVLGEFKGPEVLDALQIIDQGHDGMMMMMVADSPENALERLEMLIKMNHPDLPVTYLRAFIGATINLIVQQNRLPDGSRRLVAITEVLPVRGGDYKLQTLFSFLQTGLDERGKIVGQMRSHSISPSFARRLAQASIYLPPNIIKVADAEPVSRPSTNDLNPVEPSHATGTTAVPLFDRLMRSIGLRR